MSKHSALRSDVPLSQVHDDLARRAARATLVAVQRDLERHPSPSELDELHAVVAQYQGPEADLVRELIEQRVAVIERLAA